MIGFPIHIATRQDYINLLDMEEYRDQALEKLGELRDFDDTLSTRAIEPVNPDDPDGEWITEEIPTPRPMYMQKDFEEWEEVVELEAAGIILKESPELETVTVAMEQEIEMNTKQDNILGLYPTKPVIKEDIKTEVEP